MSMKIYSVSSLLLPGFSHDLVSGKDPHPEEKLWKLVWGEVEMMEHLYRGVTGSDSVGIFRPITRYSFKVPLAFIFCNKCMF